MPIIAPITELEGKGKNVTYNLIISTFFSLKVFGASLHAVVIMT